MAHPGGRPSKLTPELVTKAREYMSELSLTPETRLPTVEGLAYHLGISRETLYAWEKDNTEFSDILEDVRQLQAEKLIQNSIVNKYNPTIAKMMLSKYGYVEKSESDITSGGEKLGVTLSADQTEQLLRARANRSDI